MPLHPDRGFSSDPTIRTIARELYEGVHDLPLICPHTHVDPRLFADPDYRFGSPVDLLILPDHYVYRMLYSQGVPLESLGIAPIEFTPTDDPAPGGLLAGDTPVETDHRAIWRTFAQHFYLFRGTPTAFWMADSLERVFGITEKLTPDTADAIYDIIDARLHDPAFTPRALYDQFNIEVLCTTDSATDTLEYHQVIRDSGWHGRILPTFRPDALFDLIHPGHEESMRRLSDLTGIDTGTREGMLQATAVRRAYFKSMGAVATDHGVRAFDLSLPHMAEMSIEDDLVMQLHVGSVRNHNKSLFTRFGPDRGADIPTFAEFTQQLAFLLVPFGNDPRLTLILFTLDESTYSRELAPLAGHYPALKLGPPWWFHDSFNGMRRYFDQVMETAGLYNTVGFNDDTRAFLSIPSRHDMWRRASCDWLAGLVAQHRIDRADAEDMARACAYDLAKAAYKL